MTGLLIWLMVGATAAAASAQPTRTPLVRVVDLNIGESQEVELCDGRKATVKLAGLHETIDDVRSAVRAVRLRNEIT